MLKEQRVKVKINAVANPLFSGWLRVKVPAEHLQKRGWDIRITEEELPEEEDIDIVWYQPFKKPDSYVKGRKYILEFDDIMDWHHAIAPPDHFYENIKRADHVIVGNQYMVDRYEEYNDNMDYITDFLDPCNRAKEDGYIPEDGVIRIGWVGSEMYSGEVRHLLPTFKKIHRNFPNVHFVLFGFGRQHKCSFISTLPYVDYEHFSGVMSNLGLDIGITYLSDRDLSFAKTPLKIAEYAWIGAPCVASKTVYGDLPIAKRKDHIMIADDIDDYYDKLVTLIKDEKLRKKMGQNAKSYCKKNFNLHENLYKWEELFEKVL